MEDNTAKSMDVLVGESGPSQAGGHAISTFMHCPKEFQFRHVRGIKPARTSAPQPLSVGSLTHAGRAAWFATKCLGSFSDIEGSLQAEFDKAKFTPEPFTEEALSYARRIVKEYIVHWSMRPRPKPLAVEYTIGPVGFEASDPLGFLQRTAKLDDFSCYPEFGNKLCIGELKTTSASLKDCVNEYTLHWQILFQLILWKLAEQGEKTHGPVKFVMLDIILKGYGKDPCQFMRHPVPVPDATLTRAAVEIRKWVQGAKAVIDGGEAIRNYGSCTRLIGRGRVACEFRDLCQNGSSVGSQYVNKNGKFLSPEECE